MIKLVDILNEIMKPENEIFSAYNGRYLFDVTEAYRLIQSGEVKSMIKSQDPIMMYQLSHPEFNVAEPSKVASLKIDYNKPIGIIVKFRDPETEKTEWILIDGNHRTRKATEENKDAKFYVISDPNDVDKFMETNVEQPHKLFIDDED
jgi:hypothetical protein